MWSWGGTRDDAVIVFVTFKESKLKMEWELKLSFAALKQVLTFPPILSER